MGNAEYNYNKKVSRIVVFIKKWELSVKEKY